MALLNPIVGARVTQRFGIPADSVASDEPAMYASATRAYWQPYPGLSFRPHFHAALDLAAGGGTPILASETGTVVFAGWRTNGGGYCVQVEIKPNVRYEHAHCSRIVVRVGQRVARGQVIAYVGDTGWATGNHSHFTVTIREVQEYVARTFLYDPALFLPGGALENDYRIQPPVLISYVQLNGPGINVRETPILEDASNIYGTSDARGVYAYGPRKYVCALDAKLRLRRYVTNGYGVWAEVWIGGSKAAGGAYRFVKKELTHRA